MNVLVTINCKGPFSVYRAQIEMICLLQSKGVNIKVIGFYDDKIKSFFDDKGINNSNIFPKSPNSLVSPVENPVFENADAVSKITLSRFAVVTCEINKTIVIRKINKHDRKVNAIRKS